MCVPQNDCLFVSLHRFRHGAYLTYLSGEWENVFIPNPVSPLWLGDSMKEQGKVTCVLLFHYRRPNLYSVVHECTRPSLLREVRISLNSGKCFCVMTSQSTSRMAVTKGKPLAATFYSSTFYSAFPKQVDSHLAMPPSCHVQQI